MASRPLVVRSASISGFAELARSLGLDPGAIAREVGLGTRCLTTPDALVPARRAYRLLERAAAASGVADFGLRLARKRGLSHLGVLGLLARDEPDVRSALRRIIGGLNLHSTCVALDLSEQGEVALLTLTMLSDGEAEIRQAREAALALLYQILAALLGPAWRPLHVSFVHAAGKSTRAHRAMFRCPVSFSAPGNLIVLRADDLNQAVPGSDAGFRPYAGLHAAALLPVDGRVTPQRLRQTLLLLMPSGSCTSRAAAEQLGMDRRTLHRHLAQADTRFGAVLAELRAELATQTLEAGLLSLTDIAALLGFNSLSSFSRWFAAEHGMAATAWRRQRQARARTRR